MLAKLDSKRAESIDPKNKVRLIRAIEIAEKLAKFRISETKHQIPDISSYRSELAYRAKL